MLRFTVSIILLALAVAAVFLGARPQWGAVASIRAEIERLKSVSEELDSVAESRDRLIEVYNSIAEADLQKLKDIVPYRQDTAKMLVDFEALAQQNGLALERADFSESGGTGASSLTLQARQTGLYQPIPVGLALRGSYESFRGFLAGLEKNIRLTDISRISFGGAGDGRNFLFNLGGKMYYRP